MTGNPCFSSGDFTPRGRYTGGQSEKYVSQDNGGLGSLGLGKESVSFWPILPRLVMCFLHFEITLNLLSME